MGWSWAVWFVQQMMTAVMADVPWDGHLIQNAPPPLLAADSAATMIYIDNFVALSLSGPRAEATAQLMMDRLAAKGIEATREADEGPLLGFELHAGGVWRTTPHKCWQLALVLRELHEGRRRNENHTRSRWGLSGHSRCQNV